MSGEPSRLSKVMNLISNAFSVLNLDDSGDKDHLAAAGSSREAGKGAEATSGADKSNDEHTNASSSKIADKKEKRQKNNSQYNSVFKNALVWIDLEMTGLDIQVDRILEIACIITDGSLNKSEEGPDLVIHQSQECLDKMGEWCQEHHGASGLTKKVLLSEITEKMAETQVMDFLKKHLGTEYKYLIAGNSVYMDLLFLQKYMPDLANLFSHVIVDVSSVKALCIRWYPKEHKKAPQKESKHRAMDDIRESIMELKYFKQNIFKFSKSGR